MISETNLRTLAARSLRSSAPLTSPLSDTRSTRQASTRWLGHSSFRALNDSIDDATDLGKIKPGRPATRWGKVDDDDPDYFKMTVKLKGGSDLKLKLSNQETADETIYGAILNQRGRVVAMAKFKAGKTKTLSLNDVNGGTYYIRLTTRGDQVDYRFTVAVV